MMTSFHILPLSNCNIVQRDNRIENLQVLLKSEHTRLHHLGTKRNKTSWPSDKATQEKLSSSRRKVARRNLRNDEGQFIKGNSML